MPLLAFNRKDTGWRIDWQQVPKVAAVPPIIPPIWPISLRRRSHCGGIVAGPGITRPPRHAPANNSR